MRQNDWRIWALHQVFQQLADKVAHYGISSSKMPDDSLEVAVFSKMSSNSLPLHFLLSNIFQEEVPCNGS